MSKSIASTECDELDLIKLVSTNANDLNQYLLFKASNDEYYGINVSKIEEVMVFDESIDIAINNEDTVIKGTADIRDTMTTLIYFDSWFGNELLDDSEYELLVLTNYGGHKLGIIVKEVLDISTIESYKMSANSQNNAKTTFVAKIDIENEEHLCTVFDGDKMLLDVFETIDIENEILFSQEIRNTLDKKIVFYADDSKFVRNIVEKLFNILHVEYKIFHDGEDLVEYLQEHPNTQVDLFITDLEMPKMGGKRVINAIRANEFYANTPILVHTNMSNSVIEEELLQAGATQIIGKINIENLCETMQKELTQ